MFRVLWFVFCAIAGAAIGSVLLGLGLKGVPWAVVGGIGGMLLGIGFARLVPAHEFLLGLLD